MKKTLKWVGIIIAGLIVIGAIFGDSEDGSEQASGDNAVKASAEVKDDSVVNAAEEDGEEKAAKEKPKAFGIGEEVKVGNLSYVVNSVEEKTKLTMPYMDPLTTEGKFLIVDMKVTNNDKKARFIDTEMFRLVTADGTEFSADSEADMYVNDDIGFFLQEVNPKMSMSGKVAFEVPAEGEFQLQVSSGFGWSGGEYKIINLK